MHGDSVLLLVTVAHSYPFFHLSVPAGFLEQILTLPREEEEGYWVALLLLVVEEEEDGKVQQVVVVVEEENERVQWVEVVVVGVHQLVLVQVVEEEEENERVQWVEVVAGVHQLVLVQVVEEEKGEGEKMSMLLHPLGVGCVLRGMLQILPCQDPE